LVPQRFFEKKDDLCVKGDSITPFDRISQKYVLVRAGNLVLAVQELVNDTYRAMNETANPIFLNFTMKSRILKFKIQQQMVRKFPDKHWIRQN
jgi:hypothetical protein